VGDVIRRDPDAAQDETYDLVVVGAGVHGAAAALAAARAGHRVLVLERSDFGGATSWNSLRVLHGGLRYLQSLDFPRFRESVEARSWFVEEFPDLVKPLPCLMPLYGKGLRRHEILGPVLALNEALRRRWSSAAERAALPEGSILSAAEVVERFAGVRQEGLRGGALWYDGLLVRPQRVLIEMLRRAVALGAVALNYLEVDAWNVVDGRVAAVRARDTLDWTEFEFRTRAVLNCAGPWAPALAAQHDPALMQSFHPSLAFNLLLDQPLDSAVSVAVEPAGGGRTYFLHPLEERTLAGTYHAPLEEGRETPSENQVEEFLGDLRAAVPGFRVTSDHVRRVMAGVLLARRPGTADLASRPLFHSAAASSGPEGFHSLVGVKYTTAPLVAARAVADVLGGEPTLVGPEDHPPVRDVPGWTAFGLLADRDPEAAGTLIDAIVEEESVLEPDDLLLRRTDWGLDPRTRNLAEARVRRLRPKLFSPLV
jgi:glycerol-3-phosphate dehydrogenase